MSTGLGQSVWNQELGAYVMPEAQVTAASPYTTQMRQLDTSLPPLDFGNLQLREEMPIKTSWGQRTRQNFRKFGQNFEAFGGGGDGLEAEQVAGYGDIASGLGSIASGIIGGGARRREQRAAKKEFGERKSAFERLDTSNPYQNLYNPYANLTVNQQQAQFEAEQQQQGLATTMSALSGAAGASGIASLAQAMANQQSMNLQKSSASIGLQESQNARLRAQGAMQIQSMERQGDVLSRNWEAQKQNRMYSDAQMRLREANLARQQATQALVGGIGQVASGIFGVTSG